jgi:hypothetical protein
VTDDGGAFSIPNIPTNSDVGLVLDDDTHFNGVTLVSTTTVNVRKSVLMATDALAAQLLQLIGGTYPSTTTGAISFNVTDGSGEPLDGVSVDLMPASGIGPIYTTAQGVPDDSLTETPAGSNGGFFSNVEPGEYVLLLHHAASTTCRVASGWATDDSTEVGLRVVANHLTNIQATCE